MDTTNATTSEKPMKLSRDDWRRALRLMADGRTCRSDVMSQVIPGVKLSEMERCRLVRRAPARTGMAKWFPCDGYVISIRGRLTLAACE